MRDVRDIFKIIEQLDNKGVGYCIQFQGTLGFYNMAVEDSEKKKRYFKATSMKELERQVVDMWGHLIGINATVVMPLPPMPLPGV